MIGSAHLHCCDPVQVIAVASGNGGVGKTTTAINLATALANRGRRVMLMDADVGNADINIALGLQPTRDLGHVIAGQCRLDEIALSGPSGVSVLPAACGPRRVTELTSTESAGLISAFSELTQPPEVLLVDTPATLSSGTLRFIQAAHEVLLVVDRQPSAVHNAHHLIRVLRRQYRVQRLRVLHNALDEAGAAARFEQLQSMVDADLDVALHGLGNIPLDPAITAAARLRQPVVSARPSSPAATAFKRLARRTSSLAPPPQAAGGVEFFLERSIASSYMNRESAGVQS